VRLITNLDADVGDARCIVAHPLQVGNDVQDGRQAPQVGGHRLLGGNLQQRRFFNFEALPVDQHIFGFERASGDRIASFQGIHRPGDRLFDHAAEDQHFILESLELAMESATTGADPDWCFHALL